MWLKLSELDIIDIVYIVFSSALVAIAMKTKIMPY